ncbi:RNA polymerase sigma-70 factor [Compostibacter hankyongensis]
MPSTSYPPEKDILTLFYQGNIYAFELIFKKYNTVLCNFASRFVSSQDISVEIVQGVFLKLWENHDKIIIENALKSYLFRAVYNQCSSYLSHLRVRKKYLHSIRRLHETQHLTDPVQDSLSYKELNHRVHEAVAQLPEECRKIFVLSRFEGLKYMEIADRLQVSVKTVETQISRALTRLRENLKEFLLSP